MMLGPDGMRPIPGFARYFASADGTIWSLKDVDNPRALLGGMTKGYRVVGFRYGGRIHINRYVHRLVCEAFHGPPPFPQAHARHLDGNCLNNAAENLAWGTPGENEADKKRHGTRPLGEKSHLAKLTESDVLEIRSAREDGESLDSIATRYGVTFSNVSAICRRITWRHIPAARVLAHGEGVVVLT